MANLLGQDIGTNYKGIITIGSTINQNVSASLQSLTDGDGNALPLQVSTTTVAATGALTVGSDITGGFGSYTLGFSNPYVRAIITSSSAYGGFLVANNGNITRTTGETATTAISGLFAAAAGSANYKPLRLEYTINNSGAQTGTATGIFMNATLTNLNSMTHTLMDLQVGGVSAFKVTNSPSGTGITTSGSWIAYNNSTTQLVGMQGGLFAVYSSPSTRFQINLGTNEARNLGDLFLGSVTVASTARLHVRGDGTNPIFRAENTDGTYRYLMNLTQQIVNVGNGGIFSIRPNEGTTNNLGIDFVVGISGNISYMNIATRYYIGTFGSNNGQSGLAFTHTGYNVTTSFYRFYFQGGTTTITTTSGVTGGITYIDSFVPTSGTAVHNSLNLSPTINQTGGANGITRGLYVVPTLTSAADFRAIETLAGSTSAHKLIRLANATGNVVFEVNAAREIGLFGVTPIAQPTTSIAQATLVGGGGAAILEDDTFAGYTVAQVVQALVNLGILKP